MEFALGGRNIYLLGMPNDMEWDVVANTWPADQLQRYVLLHFDLMRQALNPAAHKPDLSLREQKHLLLADTTTDLGQFLVLFHRSLPRHICLPSSKENMEPRSPWEVSRQQVFVYHICFFQYNFR